MREKISMLTETDGVTFRLSAYSTRRGSRSLLYRITFFFFDQWLMEKAEDAGAQVITGVRVDEVLVKDGKVCGVKAGDDEIEAHVVILADGVNSLLAKQLGMTQKVDPHTVAVGVKELLEFTTTTNGRPIWLY